MIDEEFDLRLRVVEAKLAELSELGTRSGLRVDHLGEEEGDTYGRVRRDSLGGSGYVSVVYSEASGRLIPVEVFEDMLRCGAVPFYVIVIWHGPIEEIPLGWYLCNGQTVNGYQLPNLGTQTLNGNVVRFIMYLGGSE